MDEPFKQVPQIGPEQVEQVKDLGAGGFGRVYQVKWHGAVVAQKVFQLKSTESNDPEEQEKSIAEAYLRTSPPRHPHILQLFGGNTTIAPYFALMEYMPNGSLHDLLYKNKTKLDSRTRKRLAIEMALGLGHLHSLQRVHAGLSSKNVYINQDFTAKIGKFGLPGELYAFSASRDHKGSGRYQWLAPEVLEGKKHTRESDIYALGTIFNELASSKPPFYRMGPSVLALKVVMGKERPQISERCSPEFKKIIEKCWAQDPKDRPTAKNILADLERLADD